MLSVVCLIQGVPLAFPGYSSDVTAGKHSRMSTERARKQVFVRANLRLQHKDYKKPAFIAWDPDSVESDGPGSDDEGGDEGPAPSGDEPDDSFEGGDSQDMGVEL